jgi:hypothetical protein
MSFTLTARDLKQLEGVHPDLVRVVMRAADDTDMPFMVLEGLRTRERQEILKQGGSSWTMNSRHIKAPNGWGHAVDIAPLDNGKPSWSWPLYYKLAEIIKRAATEEGVPVVWGGDWKRVKGRSEPDGPHWELPWSRYPGKVKTSSLGGEVYGEYDEQGEYDEYDEYWKPDDYPYELDDPREMRRGRSRISWSLKGILASAGASMFGFWHDYGALVIVCVAVIVGLSIVIFREELKAELRERLA